MDRRTYYAQWQVQLLLCQNQFDEELQAGIPENKQYNKLETILVKQTKKRFNKWNTTSRCRDCWNSENQISKETTHLINGLKIRR